MESICPANVVQLIIDLEDAVEVMKQVPVSGGAGLWSAAAKLDSWRHYILKMSCGDIAIEAVPQKEQV